MLQLSDNEAQKRCEEAEPAELTTAFPESVGHWSQSTWVRAR
jgi:hypothetical protein